MSDEKATEEVYLPTGGAIPGIPGSYGPGMYQVDWTTRTVKRIVDGVAISEEEAGTAPLSPEEEAAQEAEAKQKAEATAQPSSALAAKKASAVAPDQASAPAAEG